MANSKSTCVIKSLASRRRFDFADIFFLLSGPFQEAAFNAPLGTYTAPFKTTHGYCVRLYVTFIRLDLFFPRLSRPHS